MLEYSLNNIEHMKIAIIGAGNMGGAIAAGLAKGKLVQSREVICTARTQATLDKIKAIDSEIIVTTDNSAAAKEADIIILAVKPWLMEEVITDIRPSFDPLNQIFVSVAAGVTLEELENILQPEKYTGRAKEQTEDFLSECVAPVLERYKDIASDKPEINV